MGNINYGKKKLLKGEGNNNSNNNLCVTLGPGVLRVYLIKTKRKNVKCRGGKEREDLIMYSCVSKESRDGELLA